jgi:hypothetical protein
MQHKEYDAMKTKNAMIGLVVAVMLATFPAGAATNGTSATTTERAYVLTHSSVIDGACYDSARQELTVFFRNGSAYVYREVPLPVFQSFIRSDSPGRFYHDHLRGHFASKRLSERDQLALIDRHDGRTAW